MRSACASARSASRRCSCASRRGPATAAVVASRGHFPASLGAAVRQKARWLGGIALAGWDRLGWRGGIGERWMRMRDRRGPLAALLLLAAYARGLAVVAAVARRSARRAGPGAARSRRWSPCCTINAWLLAWRILMRACFTASAYGLAQGLLSIPRLVVGNVIAMLAARPRDLDPPRRRPAALGQDPPHLPRRAARDERVAPLPRHRRGRLGRACARRRLGMLPGTEAFTLGPSRAAAARRRVGRCPAIVPTEFPPIAPRRQMRSCRHWRMPQFAAIAGLPPVRRPDLLLPGERPVAAPFYPASLPAPAPRPADADRARCRPPHSTRRSRSSTNGRCRASLRRRCRRGARRPRRRQQSLPQALVAGAARPAPADRLGAAARRSAGSGRSLATGGTLGGSQAGARLTYNFTPLIAASLRTSSPVGGARGGEVAAGVRWSRRSARSRSALTAERRQAIGRTAAGARPSPCSSKAASTSGRCRGGSASTPMPRPASSAFTQPRPVRRRRA